MIDAHGPDMATCMLRDPLPPCATPRHTQSMPSRPHAGRNPPPTNLQVDHARCALNHYLRLPLAGDWSEADSGPTRGAPERGHGLGVVQGGGGSRSMHVAMSGPWALITR